MHRSLDEAGSVATCERSPRFDQDVQRACTLPIVRSLDGNRRAVWSVHNTVTDSCLGRAFWEICRHPGSPTESRRSYEALRAKDHDVVHEWSAWRCHAPSTRTLLACGRICHGERQWLHLRNDRVRARKHGWRSHSDAIARRLHSFRNAASTTRLQCRSPRPLSRTQQETSGLT